MKPSWMSSIIPVHETIPNTYGITYGFIRVIVIRDTYQLYNHKELQLYKHCEWRDENVENLHKVDDWQRNRDLVTLVQLIRLTYQATYQWQHNQIILIVILLIIGSKFRRIIKQLLVKDQSSKDTPVAKKLWIIQVILFFSYSCKNQKIQ